MAAGCETRFNSLASDFGHKNRMVIQIVEVDENGCIVPPEPKTSVLRPDKRLRVVEGGKERVVE